MKNMVTCLVKVLSNIERLKAQIEMYDTLKSFNSIWWIANPMTNDACIMIDSNRNWKTLTLESNVA